MLNSIKPNAAIQVASLTVVSLLSSAPFLSTRAQDKAKDGGNLIEKQPLPPKIIGLDFSNLTPPQTPRALEKNTTNKLASVNRDPSAESQKNQSVNRNINSKLYTAISSLCGVVAMGWFYIQMRKKETPVSPMAISLFAANDALLAGSAYFTGQGDSGVALMGMFAIGGIFCAAVAWRQNSTTKEGLTRVDKACAILCLAGIAALTTSKIPLLTQFISSEILATAGSVFGIAVNTIASIPLVMTQVKKPADGEVIDIKNGKLWAVLKPTLPYIIATVGMFVPLMSAIATNSSHLFQPATLFLTNLALTGMTALWAFRRLPK